MQHRCILTPSAMVSPLWLSLHRASCAACIMSPIWSVVSPSTGDMLKLMSGGLLQPTLHRVLNNSGQRTRTSCAFFYEPVSSRVPSGIVPHLLPFECAGTPAICPH